MKAVTDADGSGGGVGARPGNAPRDKGSIPTNWPRLSGTEKEAQAALVHIRQYTGSDVKLYPRGEATEQIVKEVDRPRVLYLATHGYFLPDREIDPNILKPLEGFEVPEKGS